MGADGRMLVDAVTNTLLVFNITTIVARDTNSGNVKWTFPVLYAGTRIVAGVFVCVCVRARMRIFHPKFGPYYQWRSPDYSPKLQPGF